MGSINVKEEYKGRFNGIQIDNDPLEREIYVMCPDCSLKVFDSGLEI